MLCPDAMLVFLEVCFGKTLTSSFWNGWTVLPSLLRFSRSPLGWWLAIVSDIVPDKSIMFAAKSLFYTNTLRQRTQLHLFFSMVLFRWVSAFANFPRCCGRRAFLVRCLPAVNKQLGQFPEDEKHCLFRLPIGLPSLYIDWVCSSRMTRDDRHYKYLDGHVLTSRPQIIFDPYSCCASCQITLLACWIMKILDEQLLKPSCLILFDGYTCRGLHYSIQWEQSIRGNPYLGAQQCQWQALMAENCRATGHGAWGRSEKWWVLGCAPRLMTINYSNCYMDQ